MKTLSHFAKAVSAHLKHTGETQVALSKRSGISKTSLHDFLAGKRDLNFDGVVALISCLDYNARWMLTGHKSKAMLEHQKSLVKTAPQERKIMQIIEQGDSALVVYDDSTQCRYDLINLPRTPEVAAFFEHKAFLDAAKDEAKKAPSNLVVIARFKDFCDCYRLRIENHQYGPHGIATVMGGDVRYGYTYIYRPTAEEALMELIKKYSCAEITTAYNNNIIQAPNFFAPI